MIIDFSKYSSVKIGATHDVAVLDEICDFDGVVVGKACNLLVSQNAPKLGILGENFDYIYIENGLLHIGAKTSARKIFEFSKKHDIKGFELCASVPGCLGGLLKMNAGLKGASIIDYLVSVLSSNGFVSRQNCGFEYRKSDIKGVIFGASFRAQKGFDEGLVRAFDEARKNQPKGASFGSTFKNPSGDSAGRLIEAVGLKGFKIGGCEFSSKHANFLINCGGGSFDDALALINLAKKRVFESFGIQLEEEVVIL